MIHIKEVIVVEGKYDKECLKKITDAPIICTHGFELYRSKRIIESIRKMAKDRGILILTDSDRAGFRIRNYSKQCVGEVGNIKHAYIPSVKGKEKRKEKPGAEGILGVEGIDKKTLESILNQAAEITDEGPMAKVSKAQFYADGFSGRPDSAKKRAELAKALSLPPRISANALLEMINKVCGVEEYEEFKKRNP